MKLNRLFSASGIIAAIAIASLTGCAMHREKAAKESGRTAAQVSTDKAITGRVQEALATTPIYKYPDVRVSTYENTVQLSGFVLTEDQKQHATDVARNVPGVNRVINNISVKPTPTGRTEETNAPAPVLSPQGYQQQHPNQAPGQQPANENNQTNPNQNNP